MKLIILCGLVLALAYISDAGFLGLGKVQSSAAEGILKCNGRPAKGIKVKLYDEDDTDLDDLMDESVTDEDGHFILSGKEAEFTPIDPKVNIYHDCNDENTPCLKKFSIKIPDNFITEGEHPAKTFDIGQLELSGSFSGESRDCIN